MSERGSFAVDRGVFDHPVFAKEPYTEVHAWLWMLSEASWRERPRKIAGKIIPLRRGQFAHSVRHLAEVWQWRRGRVERFLRRLKTETMIETQAETGLTVVSICNYEDYQPPLRQSETPSGTAGETVARQQRDNTKKEIKESVRKDSSLRSESKRKRATGWPEGHHLSEDAVAYAESNGVPRPRLPQVWERFENYHKARGSVFVDWPAAWRTWVGNEIAYQARRQPATTPSSRPEQSMSVAMRTLWDSLPKEDEDGRSHQIGIPATGRTRT